MSPSATLPVNRQPPHNAAAERRLLTLFLADAKLIAIASESTRLRGEDFYLELHRRIYRFLHGEYARRELAILRHCDVKDVPQLHALDESDRAAMNELAKLDAGGGATWLELVAAVRELARRRRAIDFFEAREQSGFEAPSDDGDVAELCQLYIGDLRRAVQ